MIETLHFGALFDGAGLDYELRSADVDVVEARFTGNRIVVSLPRAQAHAWADGDQVGIAAEQALGPDPGHDQGTLALLIEKDFQCLAPREGEDDRDTFPNPGTESGATC